jgi:hypothetical protein
VNVRFVHIHRDNRKGLALLKLVWTLPLYMPGHTFSLSFSSGCTANRDCNFRGDRVQVEVKDIGPIANLEVYVLKIGVSVISTSNR